MTCLFFYKLKIISVPLTAIHIEREYTEIKLHQAPGQSQLAMKKELPAQGLDGQSTIFIQHNSHTSNNCRHEIVMSSQVHGCIIKKAVVGTLISND